LVDASEKRLLDDIERLMKRKLDVQPLPDIEVSSNRAPSNRATSNRAPSSRTSSVKDSPGKASDPFFYMPYEPSVAPQSATNSSNPEEKKVGIVSAKPAIGALLGGFKKK